MTWNGPVSTSSHMDTYVIGISEDHKYIYIYTLKHICDTKSVKDKDDW